MKLNLIAFLMGGVLCTGSAHAQGTVWTVDDDGPADFNEITDAIASPSVVDGDVLRVYPGSYAGFVLDKSLTIVAKAGSSFGARWCRVVDVEEFTISGMRGDLESLSVENVSGRGRIDDCLVFRWLSCPGGGIQGSASFSGCSDLVITRSSFYGSTSCYDTYPSGSALSITSSRVAIVDSDLAGGVEDKYGYLHPAVIVAGQSDVTITGSTLWCGYDLGISSGPTGAIVVGPDSVVRIRGSSNDNLVGYEASPVDADSAATVTVSGVTLLPNQLREWVTWVRPAEPYLSVRGHDDPGSLKAVDLFGPPGRLGLVLFSLVPAHMVLANDLDPFWLDPASLLIVVPLTTINQGTPKSYRVFLPADASLVGTVLIMQAWFPPLPTGETPPYSSSDPMPQAAAGLELLDVLNGQGGFLTNPANIIFRW